MSCREAVKFLASSDIHLVEPPQLAAHALGLNWAGSYEAAALRSTLSRVASLTVGSEIVHSQKDGFVVEMLIITLNE